MAGDYADYNGTAWVKQGNLVGPAGIVTTDPVETVFDNSGPGGTALSANLSSRTWGVRQHNSHESGPSTDGAGRFSEVHPYLGSLPNFTVRPERFDDMFSAASFMALGEKETSGNNYDQQLLPAPIQRNL